MPAIFLALFAAAPALAAERRFTITDFDRIEVEGPFVVELATGKPPSALATGDNGSVDQVKLDVQGRTLRVRPNLSTLGSRSGASAARVKLSTHALRAASVNGSGALVIDKAKAMRFDIAVSGNGKIGLGRVEADTLIVGLMGAGKIEIGGTAKTLRATIQGSGDLAAGALDAGDAIINADTSGRIEIGVLHSANVTATGPGDTIITGSPACTIKALGVGRVRCGNN
jgi:hypothetical protein